MRTILNYLKGGLGNQCFIYAAGRALQKRTGASHVLDIGFFPDDCRYKSQFLLFDFNVTVDSCRILPTRMLRRLDKQIKRCCAKLLNNKYNYVLERSSSVRVFQQFPDQWQGTLILNGYWQSEKYFSQIKREIALELKLKDSEAYSVSPLAAQIRACKHSVFLHLRSYKDVPGRQDGSLALPISYYHNALDYVRKVLGPFDLFVFSDDIFWTKDRLVIPSECSVTFIESKGDKGKDETYRDFYLMRLCKHGIIANSSFSWWAGWLGDQDQLEQHIQSIRIRPDICYMHEDYWPTGWKPISVAAKCISL